jgi:hypothetical protein
MAPPSVRKNGLTWWWDDRKSTRVRPSFCVTSERIYSTGSVTKNTGETGVLRETEVMMMIKTDAHYHFPHWHSSESKEVSGLSYHLLSVPLMEQQKNIRQCFHFVCYVHCLDDRRFICSRLSPADSASRLGKSRNRDEPNKNLFPFLSFMTVSYFFIRQIEKKKKKPL